MLKNFAVNSSISIRTNTVVYKISNKGISIAPPVATTYTSIMTRCTLTVVNF